MFVLMRSETDGIAVDWLVQPEADEDPAHNSLRRFVDQRSIRGPLPRLELPNGHPDQDHYVYDASSTFRYVDLFIEVEGPDSEVSVQYGKDLAGQGADGPLRPWSEFVAVLVAEIDDRWGSA